MTTCRSHRSLPRGQRESALSSRTRAGCRRQGCARKPGTAKRRQVQRLRASLVGVCLPPAFGIAPVHVWRTVNVHPPCPAVKTLIVSSLTKRGVIEDSQVAAALGAGVLEAV